MNLSIGNQNNNNHSIKHIKNQISHIAKQLDDQQKGPFNANPQTNSKENCNSINIRNNKVSGNMNPKKVVNK